MKKELTCAFLCLIIGMVVSVTIAFVALQSTEVRPIGEPLCYRHLPCEMPSAPVLTQ